MFTGCEVRSTLQLAYTVSPKLYSAWLTSRRGFSYPITENNKVNIHHSSWNRKMEKSLNSRTYNIYFLVIRQSFECALRRNDAFVNSRTLTRQVCQEDSMFIWETDLKHNKTDKRWVCEHVSMFGQHKIPQIQNRILCILSLNMTRTVMCDIRFL
jgi:hypothetical protein